MTPIGEERKGEQRELPTSKARRLMGDQHRELRRRLAADIVEINTLVDRRPPPRARLRSLLSGLRKAFVKHQSDEEAVVVPILESELPAGPVRAHRLREEHARQRAELAALCAARQGYADDELASRFDRLARALLQDIAHEEQLLLVPISRYDA